MDEMRVDKPGGYPDLSWVSVMDLGWDHSGSTLHSCGSASGFPFRELIPTPTVYSLAGNVNQGTHPLTPQAKKEACGLHQANWAYLFPGFWILDGETCWNLSIAAVAHKEDHQFCPPGPQELPQFLSFTKPGSAHFLLILWPPGYPSNKTLLFWLSQNQCLLLAKKKKKRILTNTDV